MPAKSQAQQRLMAIAEHNPSALKPKNKGVLKMTHTQLHDFAATTRKGLPVKVKKEKKHTTTISPDESVAPPDQQKQMRELM